jgi:hypothetical protein
MRRIPNEPEAGKSSTLLPNFRTNHRNLKYLTKSISRGFTNRKNHKMEV